MQRKFLEVAIEQDNSDVLQAIHTDIISILKQKVYETKMANSEAWFEYSDMFEKFSISEEKQKILEFVHGKYFNRKLSETLQKRTCRADSAQSKN